MYLGGLLLAVALAFGGGGAPAPLQEAVVQLTALAIAALMIAKRGLGLSRISDDPALYGVAALVAAVPLIQLVPLPPALWTALPGRELQTQSLALIGEADTWRPLSLFPLRTLSSFLSLLPPLVMLFIVAGMTLPDRMRMLALVWIAALLSAVLGVLQLSGGRAFYPYETGHLNYATGFLASRNAHADLLVIGIVAASGWFVVHRQLGGARPLLPVIALCLFLVIAVITTGSRSGLAMLAVTALAGLLIFVRRSRPSWRIAAAFGMAGLLAAGLYGNSVVQRSVARFDDLRDMRQFVWDDSLFALAQYFPAGSGVGTFVPVFSASERLEMVGPSYVNRAHNDYLELLLEGGALSALVLLCFLVFLLVRLHSMTFGQREVRRTFGWCVGFSWLLLAMHSVVDYPLRNQLIMVVAALLLGLTANDARSERPAGGRRRVSDRS